MKISITLVACIASASAFAPSLKNAAHHSSTKLNARPKLTAKKDAPVKKGSKPVSGQKAPAVTFPKPSIQFPWDKPEPVASKKGVTVKKGRSKVDSKGPSLTQRVFEMDLYAPVANQNDYGARNKKNLKAGQLAKKSYVPAGMSKAQYEKVRAKDVKTKKDNYDRNVAKGGVFSDFYDFYKNRGTDLKDNWRGVTNSHTMAKTKYDWQGDDDMAGGRSLGL